MVDHLKECSCRFLAGISGPGTCTTVSCRDSAPPNGLACCNEATAARKMSDAEPTADLKGKNSFPAMPSSVVGVRCGQYGSCDDACQVAADRVEGGREIIMRRIFIHSSEVALQNPSDAQT